MSEIVTKKMIEHTHFVDVRFNFTKRILMIIQPSWNKKKFLTLHFIAIFLLLSLFWIEPLQKLWKEIDIAIFRTLNNYIRGRPLQQVFWALVNIKITDILGAIFLLGLFLTFIYEAKGSERRKRVATLLFTLFWFEVSILFCKQIFTPICEYFRISRHSPTVELQDFISLSSIMPWLKIKDSSYFCFPADHGAIVFQWCLLFTFFAGTYRGSIAFISSFFLLLPRLISGAHWFSDLAVGSVSITLFVYAWATATPLYSHIYQFFLKLVKPKARKKGNCL